MEFTQYLLLFTIQKQEQKNIILNENLLKGCTKEKKFSYVLLVLILITGNRLYGEGTYNMTEFKYTHIHHLFSMPRSTK